MKPTYWKTFSTPAVVLTILAGICCFTSTARSAESNDKEPLKLTLPAPTLKGTPEDLPKGPNIDPIPEKAGPAFMIAKGVKNVALGKTVTASIKPFAGELSQVTDGKKEAFDYDAVEMKKGTQWVQVDLGEPFEIHAVVVWYDHRRVQVMHDVIVLASDDPEFNSKVTTLFNNDMDNSSGLGVGTDREYFETNQGKIVDAKGVKARYIRCYAKGSTVTALNCFEEIEVYALPAK